MKKLLILFFPLVVFAKAGMAQQDSILINRSSIAVYKAQKEMMSTNTANMNGDLARAVILQTYAVKLFRQHQPNKAICYSAAARKYCKSIINTLSPVVTDTLYNISPFEQNFLINCGADTTLFNQASQHLHQMSKADSSYLGIYPFNNIDLQ